VSVDRDLIALARDTLTRDEFDVWISKNVVGYGRRAGSLALGITEEAWRYRLNAATRKVQAARDQEAA
jgi:hypothetical protein